MKNIEEKFNKIILTEMAFSIIYAILGLIVFLKSEMTNNLVGKLIGVFFLISGIIQIITFFDKKKISIFTGISILGILSIILGILSIVVGIFIFFNPLTLLNILNISLGIWILLEGINKFMIFWNLKRIKEESSKIFLVSSLLLVFMGVTIIINPFRTLVITKTVGAFIMLYNVINLNDLVLLKKQSNKFLRLFNLDY